MKHPLSHAIVLAKCHFVQPKLRGKGREMPSAPVGITRVFLRVMEIVNNRRPLILYSLYFCVCVWDCVACG
jgi:hypothetical protein